MVKEIKFQGVIELDADDEHIAQQLTWDIMDRLDIGIYTMCGAIRTKAGSVKLTYPKPANP